MSEYVYESIKTFVKDLECEDKDECLKKMANELSRASAIDANELFSLLKARERFGSTALGGYFALPHTKTNLVKELISGIFITKEPIDFGSIDGMPTQIFFTIIAPSIKPSILLKALAKVAKIFKDDELKEQVMSAENLEEVIEIIKNKELTYE
jgi:mannitol/fructose-specific phosphotransferase system IIA component (Ntr-type)